MNRAQFRKLIVNMQAIQRLAIAGEWHDTVKY
jgi:hypothetical protein